ncbi:MAG: hypothetical protein V4616_02750 [Bacteroidota bacterium]
MKLTHILSALSIALFSISAAAQTKPPSENPKKNPTTGTRVPDTTNYDAYRKGGKPASTNSKVKADKPFTPDNATRKYRYKTPATRGTDSTSTPK